LVSGRVVMVTPSVVVMPGCGGGRLVMVWLVSAGDGGL
jgi:hypothetical protein